MSTIYETTRLLITVMTYPHPSQRYRELVCTAGVTEKGDWVRLYPVDYRYRPPEQQYHKYQWIEVGLTPRGQGNDGRKESRKPDLGSIVALGAPLPAGDWRQRREVIDRLPTHTLNELKALYALDRTSLGIVRPKQVLDLEIQADNRPWKPKWQAEINQLRLFEAPPKPLVKIPFKFRYVFKCEDSARPHRAMIEDWELGVLYLKEVVRLGSEHAAAQSVRSKFLDEMCSPTRDTRFFMGTRFPYNTWLVLGVFWPPRAYQPELGI